jgi:hypothetical protein
MKKLILLISGLLLGNMLNSQVILNIESPASLAGNYNMTFADPADGWSSPDMLDPANALTGVLAIVDDGTVGDSLGCNELINPTEIAGKIAVVYRGSCEFGTKAFMAQNAGAIGVILINNVPGDPLGMLGGTDGLNVTIPVAMISQIDGQVITTVVNDGQDVTVFIGNKNGLFDTDMGVKDFRILLPTPNTTHTMLAQNGTEHNFRVGAWLYNYGVLDQTGVQFTAVVNQGDNVIYTETATGLDIVSGDSIYVELPVFSEATYAQGTYTLSYTITTTATDEYMSDNNYDVDFNIGNTVFSHVKTDANGMPIATTGYRATNATTTFSACVHFRHPNASRLAVEGLYFSASTNADGSLEGQALTTTMYKINDVFGDLNDLDFNVTGAGLLEIEEVTSGEYTYQTDTMEFNTVYAPFSARQPLIDNQRYMFCVSTFDVNTYIGYGDLDYSWTIDTVLQPMFPIQVNSEWAILGFGGESAAIGVRMIEPTVNGAPVAINDYTSTPYQTAVTINPSTNDLDLSGAVVPSSVTIVGTTDGTATVNAAGAITFTPANGFTGNGTVTYSICDNGTPQLCATAVITITVINTEPTAANDQFITPYLTPVTFNVTTNDTDATGQIDPLSVTIVSPSTDGETTVDPLTGEITFTPNVDFSGLTSFSYSVCDNGTPVLCSTADVIVVVGQNSINENSLFSAVYPNPTASVVYVKGENLANFTTVELKDQLGRTVKSWTINSTDLELDLKSVDAGNYFLQFVGTSLSTVEKIQIVK